MGQGLDHTTVSRVERRLGEEAKFWVPSKIPTFAVKLTCYSKFNSNGGKRNELFRFGDSQAHKMKLKLEFIGFAVT